MCDDVHVILADNFVVSQLSCKKVANFYPFVKLVESVEIRKQYVPFLLTGSSSWGWQA